MLEHLVYLTLHKFNYMNECDNVLSADNQQERLFANGMRTESEMAWYVVGFTDGEGSFNVSLKRERSYGIGWKVGLSFNISQKDSVILRKIQNFFGCGTVRFRKDGVGYFEVRSFTEIEKYVIPFFDQYRLQSKKIDDYETFRTIARLVFAKEHLTYSGMERLLQLRSPMNGGGKRKFSISEILSTLHIESSETIRQIRLSETKVAK